MTKKAYLKKLENLIQALPEEERKEALDYYSAYFDDADDDEKVFQELGKPEELAKAIIEKFSCVPAKKNSAEKAESDEEEFFDAKQNDNQSGEKKFFFFEKDKVKNLGISIGVGNVFLRNGKDFQVETRGINSENFRCEINQAGTLIIENRRNIPGKRFFSHDSKSHWCPRFLITLPAETVLENLKINLGAGQLRSEKLNLTSDRTMLDVSAGNFELSGIKSSVNSIRCGMGNVKINGIFTEYTEIDCGMGYVQIKMPVTSEKYSYEGKVAMGNIQFAKEKRSGFAQNYSGARSENHFSIKCGMGEVKVLFDEF
ncbi:MAG: DUF1700 domain-containing protein [Spirochaetia bacterium]|nr:DUF1700 domain-containing protein [Spirochaetia bacterium]